MVAAFRDYVYVSDRKLRDFRGKVPRRILEGVAVSLKVSVKVIEAAFSKSPTRETREAMIMAVRAHLADEQKIGSVDDPRGFFEGVLPMRWGPSDDVHPPVVVFSATTQKTVVALGGSLKHANPDAVRANDTAPSALSEATVVSTVADGLIGRNASGSPLSWEQAVFKLTLGWKETEEEFEFLAVRHLYSEARGVLDGHGRRALLGSPVYVARLL